MSLFFISDHHFFHERITNGELDLNRGFASVEAMHERIIEQHNRVVHPKDSVWFLGDLTLMRPSKSDMLGVESGRMFALRDILHAMNGRKSLLLGNHDHLPIQEYLWFGFEDIRATFKLHQMLFSHVPMHPSQLYRFRGNVHGHTHEKNVLDSSALHLGGPLVDPHYINVSVEAVNYTPQSLDELQAKFTRRGL